MADGHVYGRFLGLHNLDDPGCASRQRNAVLPDRSLQCVPFFILYTAATVYRTFKEFDCWVNWCVDIETIVSSAAKLTCEKEQISTGACPRLFMLACRVCYALTMVSIERPVDQSA